MTLGEYLKELRKKSGYGIRAIASNSDIDQSTLCKYENGHRVPPFKHLIEFARIYGVDVNTFNDLAVLDLISYIMIDNNVDERILKDVEAHYKYTKAKLEKAEQELVKQRIKKKKSK